MIDRPDKNLMKIRKKKPSETYDSIYSPLLKDHKQKKNETFFSVRCFLICYSMLKFYKILENEEEMGSIFLKHDSW